MGTQLEEAAGSSATEAHGTCFPISSPRQLERKNLVSVPSAAY